MEQAAAIERRTQSRNRVRLADDANEHDGSNGTGRRIAFRPNSCVFRYPPAVWNEEDEDADEEWDEDEVEYEDAPIKDDDWV